MMRIVTLLALTLAACSGDLAHDGPFDPDAPLEKQARGEVAGVVALEGETDAAGVNVQLQNDARTYDVDTAADGSFRLTGVVPGTYVLRIGARFFEEQSSAITVLLGETVDLGTVSLALRTAGVTGSALVASLEDGAVTTRGGAIVTLAKTGSARAASEAPYLPAALRTYAAEVTRNYTTTSAGDGSFSFTDVDAGVYDLVVETPGATLVKVSGVTVTGEDGDVDVEPVTLEKVSGTFTIDATAGGNASLVYSDSATVGLTFTAYGTSAIDIGESNDGTAAGCSFTRSIPLAASATHTLGGQGRRYVCARFVDADGNRSETVVRSIFVDGDAPAGTVSLNSGAAYATSAGPGTLAVNAADAGSGVANVKIAELGAHPTCAAALSSASAEAFTSLRAVTIPAGDGVTLTLCALFGDAAGNWMAAPVSDSIVVDTVAPSAPAVSIEAGAVYATSQVVTLTLSASGATEMRIANGSSPASASWEPYRTSTTWFLPTGTGSKEVSVQFRDAAGNTSLVAADTINLDTEAPASPSLTVSNANTAGYVASSTADLALFAVGATQMQLSRDGFFDAEPVENYATAATLYLSGGDGVKLIYARFLDDAGNASTIAAASVVVDTAFPETGFVRIDDGADWTTDADVELSFTATGADEVAISQGACPTAGWQAYATRMAYTLTGLDSPSITVYAKFRDRAGNTTACISDAIGMDRLLVAPAFAAAATGEEGVSGATAQLRAWVTLSGITADVYEMQVDDDSAFGGAAWRPVATKFSVPLTKGDGTKTAYVRVRDRAGNTSSASTPSIDLDQTGPESPSLVVTDHTGDGFAVTEAEVELVWSKPTDAHTYAIERFVLGVDGTFTPIAANIPAATMKYTDDVTATVGNTHLYRVRALDRLGNPSSYSVAVQAYPFEPIRRVFKTNTSQGWRYFFKPNKGTYSLRPSYTYFDVNNDEIETSLVENTVDWIRPAPAGDVYEESLTLRTSNQDGSLVYDTFLRLGLNLRQKIMFNNRGWQQRIAADVTGAAHIVHANFNGLNYLTNEAGAWTEKTWYDGSWPGVDRHPSVAIDGSSNPHILYYGDNRPRYKTESGGVWSDEIVDTATGTGTYTDIAVDRNGIPNAVYFDETKQDLKFARRSGSWVTQAVDTAGDVGRFARLALDSAGKAHVVYYDATSGALKYATNKTGSWALTTLDTGIWGWSLNWYGTSSGAAGVAVGKDDQPRVVYAKANSLLMKTFDGVAWQSETVIPVMFASFPALALDRGGNPVITYFDETTYDLHLARKNGTWSFTPIHTAADPGRYVSVAGDGFGDLHLAFADDGAQAGYLRLVEPRTPATIDSAGDVGFGGAATVGPRDAVYMAYWNRTTKQLVFRTNKNGFWETEAVTTVTNAPSEWNRVHIATRPVGTTFVVYKDPDVDGLRWWLRSSAGNWSNGLIDSGPSVGDYPFLAMAPDRTLWVTYRAWNGSAYELRYSSRVGNNPWAAPQVLDSNPWSDYVSPIGFKADGTVVVYFGHVGRWWEKAPAASTFTQNTTSYNQIPDGAFVFDAAGKLHAAARDPGADKIYYATNKNGVWEAEYVSPSGLPGTDTKIYLDQEGFVHIVYYDVDFQAVRYATNATGGWVVVTLDSSPKVGKFLSALVDSRYRTNVFYYDEINGDLKNLYDYSGWIEPESVSLSTPF